MCSMNGGTNPRPFAACHPLLSSLLLHINHFKGSEIYATSYVSERVCERKKTTKALCHTFFLLVSLLLCLQLRSRHKLVNMLVNGYLQHNSCNSMDYFYTVS